MTSNQDVTQWYVHQKGQPKEIYTAKDAAQVLVHADKLGLLSLFIVTLGPKLAENGGEL
jgi:hypothetical protein